MLLETYDFQLIPITLFVSTENSFKYYNFHFSFLALIAIDLLRSSVYNIRLNKLRFGEKLAPPTQRINGETTTISTSHKKP